MFPLDKRKIGGYTFGQPTFYKTKHTGTDYEALYVPYRAPFDGTAFSAFGVEGGWYWTLTRPNGDVLTARHLRAKGVTGNITQGQLVATTGNTGKFTTKPHLHQEVKINGKLIDPETYNWNETPSLKTTFMKVTIVANKIAWDYKANFVTLRKWFKDYSGGKLEVVFDTVETSFDDIPLSPFQNNKSVDINWYREHITPLGTGEATVLLLNPDQYPNTIWGFMTYGDPNSPVRCECNVYDDPNFPEAHIMVHRVFHELCHALYFLTGQPDRTHELLLSPNYPANRSVLLGEIDYQKLQQALTTIKPQTMNTFVKTINLDGEIAGYVPLRNDKDIELFNLIFNKQVAKKADGTIPTDLTATKK